MSGQRPYLWHLIRPVSSIPHPALIYGQIWAFGLDQGLQPPILMVKKDTTTLRHAEYGASHVGLVPEMQVLPLLMLLSVPEFRTHKHQKKPSDPHTENHCVQLHASKPAFLFRHACKECHVLTRRRHAGEADIETF